MNCPSELARIILSIVQIAVLRIRAAGWNNDPERCGIEADHIHNLPNLLSNYRPDLLAYYWDVERVAFVERSRSANLEAFDPLWKRLEEHIANLAA